MTPHEFWEDDVELVRAYRKAQEYRIEQDNWKAHLQGQYIYEAILDISPILNPFAKKGTKAIPYPEKPYELHIAQESEEEKEEPVSEEKKVFKRNKSYMEIFMTDFNKQFTEKQQKEKEING